MHLAQRPNRLRLRLRIYWAKFFAAAFTIRCAVFYPAGWQLLALAAGDNGAHGHGHKPATGRAAGGAAVGMAAEQRKEIEELWRQNRRQQQLLELQAEKAALRTTPNLDKSDI